MQVNKAFGAKGLIQEDLKLQGLNYVLQNGRGQASDSVLK